MSFQDGLSHNKEFALLVLACILSFLTVTTEGVTVIVPRASRIVPAKLSVKYTGTCNTKVFNCSKTFPSHTVVGLSYDAHIAYIRRGVPKDVVEQFYNHALEQMLRKCCVCSVLRIEEQCVNDHFVPQTDDASLDLWWFVADDGAKISQFDKAFPNLISDSLLPNLDEMTSVSVEEHRKKTTQLFKSAVQLAYNNKKSPTAAEFQGHVVSLPSDDRLLHDPKRADACEQFSQRITKYSIAISATALTSYAVGLVHQLAIISESSGIWLGTSTREKIDEIMKEHVELAYMGSRCVRKSGSKLLLPTIYVDSIVNKAALALRMARANAHTSTTLLQGLPQLSSVALLAHVGRKFFPLVIERLSGVASSGTSKVVTWTGSTVLIEDVPEIIMRNSTVDEVELFSNDLELRKASLSESCGGNYEWVDRIDHVNDWHEQCCSKSCVRTIGYPVDIALLNEMCCLACNVLQCDINELTHVHSVLEYWAQAKAR